MTSEIISPQQADFLSNADIQKILSFKSHFILQTNHIQ